MIERLDRFMARANAAYYATRDPFADFTTAPEISQVFGELLGLWTCVVWQMMGKPASVIIAEAGPGRGHLLHDALRAAGRAMPDFTEAASIHFVETSPSLVERLMKTFPAARIHSDLLGIPKGPMILIANEFFDALPIRQFVRHDAEWSERYVEAGRFVELPTEIPLPDDAIGTVREWNEATEAFVATLSKRLACQGGAALLIDYGPTESGPGDTLQAIAGGVPADPLAQPGMADLTAHVDFGRIAEIARKEGCSVTGPVSQGAFLAKLGIHERTAQLGKEASPDAAFRLLAATRRLTAAEAMGSLFKALGIGHPTLSALPGFMA